LDVTAHRHFDWNALERKPVNKRPGGLHVLSSGAKVVRREMRKR
jgi:hypothetical protein